MDGQDLNLNLNSTSPKSHKSESGYSGFENKTRSLVGPIN